MSIDRIVALMVIFAIAWYCAREPELLLIGWKPERAERPLSFREIEEIRTLRQVTASVRKEPYQPRHRLPSQREYRRELTAIVDPEEARYAPLYEPWRPDWFDPR